MNNKRTKRAPRRLPRGTTPYGREICRRILDLAWRRGYEKKSFSASVREVEKELAKFPELHSEFVLMLGRTNQADDETLGRSGKPEQDYLKELEGTSLLGWAAAMVLRGRLARIVNPRGAGDAPPELA